MPLTRGAALVVLLALAGCRAESMSGPEVRLLTPPDAPKAAIEVAGLEDAEVRLLRSLEPGDDRWPSILRVYVGDGQTAMLGDYTVVGRALRFTPMFALDAGRDYHVAFRSAAIPGVPADNPRAVSGTVGLPAVNIDPTTVVAHVFPSADVVPENQLRLYIHFSAPMGRKGGLDYVTLVDDRGAEVIDPFLPLDAEFWNDDRTRYTVFFDPGRQKRGILPNQQMGRSLEPGRRYALVVSREWRDGNGLPLKEDFRREFTVGPADERPLDVKAWKVTSPAGATREPVVVTFPEPLDHGLLLRAMGIAGADGRFVDGDVRIEAHETRWSFTPREPWAAGPYQLVALAMLEDLAGNRIGRAFEVDNFDRSDRSPEPERTLVPLTVR